MVQDPELQGKAQQQRTGGIQGLPTNLLARE